MMTICKYIFGGIALVVFNFCNSGSTSTKTGEVVLIPSTDCIDATGKETVTFTVFADGEDVTQNATVFMLSNDSELTNKSFSTTTPGVYGFYAIYDGVQSKNITVRATAVELLLTSDKETIRADGEETVTFTLIKDDEDITRESTLYLLGKNGETIEIEGYSFSTEETGIYDFYAIRDSIPSNIVSIRATPPPPAPLQWSFRERSLILEYTALHCGPCSLMKAGIKQLESEGWDDGYVVEVHFGDELTADSVIDQLLTIGYGAASGEFTIPLVTFNFADTPRHTSANSDVTKNANLIKDLTNQANEAYPCTAGGTVAFSSNGSNTLNVTSNVAISENGEYKVSCWLLENNITAVQNTGGYPEPPNYDINNHLNVLRAIYNDDAIGQEITAGANETQSFEWDFDMDALENGNAEDAHVLIVISKKEDNDKFIVNNVIRCDFNDATGYEYAE